MTTHENPFLDGDDDEVSTVERKPWERDYTDEQRAEMKKRKANGELLPGHKRKKSKYGRRDLTEIDLRLLTFLARFRYSSSAQVGVLLGVKEKTAARRLLGLRELKLVERADVPGARVLWFATKKATSMLEVAGMVVAEDISVVRSDRFDISAIAHTLAVGQVAAQLLAGKNALGKAVGTVEFDDLISEAVIRREWGTVSGAFTENTAAGKGYAGEQLKKATRQRVQNEEIGFEDILAEEPALWTLTSMKASPMLTKQFHHPDLVINREMGREKAAQSIAVEIELTEKSASEYEKTLRTYAQDKFVYSRVVWVVQTDRVMKKVAKAAKSVGLTGEKVGFVQLIGADGKPFTGRAWAL